MIQLDQLISAVLTTNDAVEPTSPAMAARMAGTPYDSDRLERFSGLVKHLDTLAPESIPALEADAERRRLLPFYESYFSNFIEGTEFTLDEAAEIVFDRVVSAKGPPMLTTFSGPTRSCPISRRCTGFRLTRTSWRRFSSLDMLF